MKHATTVTIAFYSDEKLTDRQLSEIVDWLDTSIAIFESEGLYGSSEGARVTADDPKYHGIVPSPDD